MYYGRIKVQQASSRKTSPNPCGPQYNHRATSKKENSLFAQLPQEIDKCTRTQTPRCRCELILSAHVTGYALEDCLCCAPLGLRKAEMRAALVTLTE